MTNVGISLQEMQVYVGTYRKYNNGNLFGKWIKLSDFENYDDFKANIKALHSDEDDPEFMFQDYEVPSFLVNQGFISESFISSQIFRLIKLIEDSSFPLEVWEAYFDCFGMYYDDLEDLEDKISERYQGEYNSDEDFAENILTETGSIPADLPSYIYIDWQRTARDIMMDYSASDSHYFRCL